MHLRRYTSQLLTSVAAGLLFTSAGAMTLEHRSLGKLTDENEIVVRGKVLETKSYWNDNHTFILTDVKVRPSEFLKSKQIDDVTFTIMGGTVGDATVLIVGGVELSPESEYVFFLNREDLPGARGRLTIREHVQGVFDVKNGRAFSQALGHPLVPDSEGAIEAPGGVDGLTLETLGQAIRSRAGK